MSCRCLTACLWLALIAVSRGSASDPVLVWGGSDKGRQCPDVAIAADGSSVVAWQGTEPTGAGWDIFIQRFGVDRKPAGKAVRVNADTAGDQTLPRLAMMRDGQFAVIWVEDPRSLFVQRYAADGTRVGDAIRIDGHQTDRLSAPAISAMEDGGFVAAWQSLDVGDEGWNLFGRFFGPDGKALTDERRVHASAVLNQIAASVATLNAGAVVVAFQNEKGDNALYDILAAYLSADGRRLKDEFRVNTHVQLIPSYGKMRPAVASNGTDRFVVVWGDFHGRTPQDGDGYGVFGQVFSFDGRRIGEEFQVSETGQGDQHDPSVAMCPDGSFVAAWANETKDDRAGIFARRFSRDARIATSEMPIVTRSQGYDVLMDRSFIAVNSSGKEALLAFVGEKSKNEQGVFVRWFSTTAGINRSGR